MYGSGHMARALGCSDQGFGFQVSGFRFRVSGFGFQVSGLWGVVPKTTLGTTQGSTSIQMLPPGGSTCGRLT